MFSKFSLLVLYGGVFVVFTILGPCNESLPPYTEPEVFLEAEMRGQYVCTLAAGNRMIAYLDVTNIYEETLDDTVQFNGWIEFRSMKRPDIKRTFTVTASNLLLGPGYNRQTRRLTFDPEKTLVFSVSWDLSMDDRGVDPRAELFTFYEDPTCTDRDRCIASREEFLVSGELFIFDQRAPVKASMIFPQCYYSRVVPPPFMECTEAQTDPTCIVQADTLQNRCFPFGVPGAGE